MKLEWRKAGPDTVTRHWDNWNLYVDGELFAPALLRIRKRQYGEIYEVAGKGWTRHKTYTLEEAQAVAETLYLLGEI